MRRPLIALVLVAIVAVGAGQTIGAGTPASAGLQLTVPAAVDGNTSVAVEFSVPPTVAALDGRLLFDTAAAEVVGLAPVGGGTALAPQPNDAGVAFGAYGLNPARGATRLRLVINAHTAAEIDFTLVIDAAADAAGKRLTLGRLSATGKLRVAGGGERHPAPLDRGSPRPARPAGALRDLLADGVVGAMDLDLVRSGWEAARLGGSACGGADAGVDANRDGCLDIVDIQLVVAALGTRTGGRIHPTGDSRAVEPTSALPASDGIDTRLTAAAGPFRPPAPTALAAGATFVVTSSADTPDAANGDGLCANSSGECTLRAAITESNWQRGDNRIEFNLPGQAPVLIQLGSQLSLVQDRSGGLVIDGYSQPGAQVNTAAAGSNAVPGVLIRGTGNTPRAIALRVTSPNNVVRGISLANAYRGIVLDGADASNNLIVGNLFGYTASGAVDPYEAYTSVLMNSGAHDNRIGTAALEDRNVSRAGKSFYLYGPGTDRNVIQNNLLCLTPSGMAEAMCSTGIDTDFGPKHNVYGGTGAGEQNVVGATRLNGIELSHGWDPDGVDTTDKWQVNENRIVGNWIGFRGDGASDPALASAHNNPGSGDNGNGINMHDGSNRNIAEGNWVSSVWDGIQSMSPNSSGNIIRSNIIGESPLGQPALLGRDGVVVRINTRSHVVESNTIRNAGRYGIALRDKDVLWVRVTRNVITDMAGVALFMAQDPNDPSSGADGFLPMPVITSATTVEVRGQGVAGATVELYKASRGAGQVGLPSEFLAATDVALDGSWSSPVVLTTGERVTALQIMPNGNTSRLALNVSATFEQPPNPPSATFMWTQLAGTQEVGYQDTSTGDPAAWTWDFGDGTSSNEQNPSHAYAAAGQYTVVMTVTNAGGSSTATQSVTVDAASTVVVAGDSFTRTVTGGWGSADVGGAYTLFKNAANYSVANGVGVMMLPAAGATRSTLLGGVSQRNADIRVRVAFDKVATGASQYVYLVARQNGTSEYRPRIIFNTNGTATVSASIVVNGAESSLGAPKVVPGMTQVPGGFVWVRAELTGASPTTIRVKAWPDGQPEPSAWIFTATNSNAALQAAGSFGVRGHVSPGASNAPVQIRFDDYAVSTTASSTTVASDGFARTLTGDWGSADIGGLYSEAGTDANFNVANGVGTMAVPGAGQVRAALLNEASEQNVDVRLRVAIDKVATGGNYIFYAVCRRQGSSEYRPRIMFNANGTISVSASIVVNGAESSLGTPVVVPGLTQAPGAFVWLQAQVTDANPTTIRVKAWADGQAEPANWQFTATNSQAVLQGVGGVGLRAYVHRTATNLPVTFSIDDYSVVGSR